MTRPLEFSNSIGVVILVRSRLSKLVVLVNLLLEAMGLGQPKALTREILSALVFGHLSCGISTPSLSLSLFDGEMTVMVTSISAWLWSGAVS